MNIINYIPKGKANAVGRKYLCSVTNLSDREVREQISRARRTTVILSCDLGGYYLPTIEESGEVTQFVNRESKRARSIFWSLKGARDWEKENAVIN